MSDQAALDRRGGRHRAKDPGNVLTAQGFAPRVRHGGPSHPGPPIVILHTDPRHWSLIRDQCIIMRSLMCITYDSESILGVGPGDKAALDRRGDRYRAEDPGNFLTAQGDTPRVRHGGPRHPGPPPV